MVKHFVYFMAIFLLASAGYLHANTVEESEYYVKTVPIDKVYRHAKGYKLDYMTSARERVSIWVPSAWMQQSTVNGEEFKVEISIGKRNSYPYVSFFYKSGKLVSLKIYARENPLHSTWETLSTAVDYTDYFPASLEELQEQIKY